MFVLLQTQNAPGFSIWDLISKALVDSTTKWAFGALLVIVFAVVVAGQTGFLNPFKKMVLAWSPWYRRRYYRSKAMLEWNVFNGADIGIKYRIPLSQVYISQRLASWTSTNEQDFDYEHDRTFPHIGTESHDLLFNDFCKSLKPGALPFRRILVGGVGMGKSLFLKHFGHRIASHPGKYILVIRLECSSYVRGTDFKKWILNEIDRHWPVLDAANQTVSHRLLDEQLGRNTVLLLLDGLDETSTRISLLDALKSFGENVESKNVHYLITTRKAALRNTDTLGSEAEAIELLAFTDSDIALSLSSFFKFDNSNAIRELANQLRLDSARVTRSLCSNPQMLMLLVQARLRKKHDQDFVLPISRRAFYRLITTHLLIDRPESKKKDDLDEKQRFQAEADIHVKEDVLQTLARTYFDRRRNRDNVDRFDEQTIVRAIIDSMLKQNLIRRVETRDVSESKKPSADATYADPDAVQSASRVLHTLVTQNALLRLKPAGLEMVYLFPHRSLLEYFGARRMVELLKPHDFIKRYGDVDEFFGLTEWYCALSTSGIELFVEYYLNARESRKAAHCLLAAHENVLQPELVEKVCKGLQSQAIASDQLNLGSESVVLIAELAAIEWTSFLAARTYYSEVIKKIFGQEVSVASAQTLKRMVEADNAGGIDAIKQLLSGPLGEWSVPAVLVLRDTATKEGSELLFELVHASPHSLIRSSAAVAITQLVATNSSWVPAIGAAAMKRPVENDNLRWPLHELADSRFVLPLLDALSHTDIAHIKSISIQKAVQVSRTHCDHRNWRSLGKRYQRKEFVKQMIRRIAWTCAFGAVSLVFAMLLLSTYFWCRNELIIFQHPLEYRYASDETCQSIVASAKSLARIQAALYANVAKSTTYSTRGEPQTSVNPTVEQRESYHKMMQLGSESSVETALRRAFTEEDRRIAKQLRVTDDEFDQMVNDWRKMTAAIAIEPGVNSGLLIPPLHCSMSRWNLLAIPFVLILASIPTSVVIGFARQNQRLIRASIAFGSIPVWGFYFYWNQGTALIRFMPIFLLTAFLCLLLTAAWSHYWLTDWNICDDAKSLGDQLSTTHSLSEAKRQQSLEAFFKGVVDDVKKGVRHRRFWSSR